MLPEELANKNIGNTTKYYLGVEVENRKDPSRRYKYKFSVLRYSRQQKTMTSYTLFPKIKYDRGNTCSQFFWELHMMYGVYTLKKNPKME